MLKQRLGKRKKRAYNGRKRPRKRKRDSERERGSKENVRRRKGLSRSNWPRRLKQSGFILSRKRQK